MQECTLIQNLPEENGESSCSLKVPVPRTPLLQGLYRQDHSCPHRRDSTPNFSHNPTLSSQEQLHFLEIQEPQSHSDRKQQQPEATAVLCPPCTTQPCLCPLSGVLSGSGSCACQLCSCHTPTAPQCTAPASLTQRTLLPSVKAC